MKRLTTSDSHTRGTKIGRSARQPFRTSRALRLGFEHLEERRVLAGWVESMGGAADETFYGYNSQQSMDADGNAYLTGRFSSQSADFDPGPLNTPSMNSAGGADAFAGKYRADGSFVWARRFGSTGDDGTSANAFVSEAGTGYLYVAGTFEGSVDFGSGVTLTSAGGADLFIAKLNADTGATIFAKRIGTTSGTESVVDLKVANNQVFVGGTFDKKLDFDPGPGTVFRSPAGQDGFILQLDSNGAYKSSYQFGGSGTDRTTGLAAEATSSSVTSVYLLGGIGRNVDLDPGPAVKNATGRFIAKYSIPTATTPSWSPDWVGSIGADSGSGSLFTDADSLYFVGRFTNAQDFDPGLGVTSLTAASVDGVAAKYNKTTGTLDWASQYGGEGGVAEGFNNGIVVDNTLYLSFHANTASLDFDPAGPGGEVSGNAIGYEVLLKLNAQGDYQQVWQMGGTGTIWSRVAGTAGSSVYVGGYFSGTANFPTGQALTSAGGSNIFLMALEDPTAPAPLIAASLPATVSQQPLTATELQPILAEAYRRWQLAGVSPTALAGINVQVADLPGNLLGQAAGGTILLDRNAAGWGWFVDATPRDDAEFFLAGNQGERDRMDLLTVVMHELGHALGYDHDEGGVMAETLAAGVRRTGLEHDGIALAGGDQQADAWLGAWLSEQFDSAHGRAKRRR